MDYAICERGGTPLEVMTLQYNRDRRLCFPHALEFAAEAEAKGMPDLAAIWRNAVAIQSYNARQAGCVVKPEVE